MSADNYLYVFEYGGKFYVNMLWASCEYDFDRVVDGHLEDNVSEPYPLIVHERTPEFDTLSEAIDYAERESMGEYPDHWTEYGYSIHPHLSRPMPTYAQLLHEWERAGRPELPE